MPEGNARKECSSPRDGLPSPQALPGPLDGGRSQGVRGGCANPQFCRLDFSPDTRDLTPGKELATLPLDTVASACSWGVPWDNLLGMGRGESK